MTFSQILALEAVPFKGGRSGAANLRTGLLRILKRAQINHWPKLFQNLRASRETELMRTEPAHVVHHWLGNSRDVTEDHYLMVTEADYDRVTSGATEKAVQNPVHSDAVSDHQTPSLENESAVSPAFAKDTAVQIPPRGVELLQNPREIPQSRKIPDQIPDHFGWPPISETWFDSSRISRRGNAKPS